MEQDNTGDALRVAAFNTAMRETLGWADLQSLENCIGCKRCSALCTWSLAGGTQPLERSQAIRTALAGTEPRAVRRTGTAQVVGALAKLSEQVFGSCTMCRRCNVGCPYGVNKWRLTFAARGALLRAGFASAWAQRISKNAATGHTFGRTSEQVWADLLPRIEGLGEVRMDQPAEWLVVCSAIANTKIPDIVYPSFYLLQEAGIDFTLSEGVVDTGTEVHTAVYDSIASAQYADRLIATARRNGCSGLVAGECGCDVWWFLVGGAKKFREAGLKVATFDQLMLDAIRKGRLHPRKLDLTVTFHDPCWTGRGAGDFETAREILGHCVKHVVELRPNREHAYCCNGGAGMMHAHPASDPVGLRNLRRDASAIKAEQLRRANAQGATYVVTPCASCVLSLDDTARFHNLPIGVTTLNQLLMEAIRG